MDESSITNVPSSERHGVLCENCARPARVHILEGYRRGSPIRRHFCLACADDASAEGAAFGREPAPGRMSAGALLMAAGAALVLIGLLIDQFGYHGSVGFGWKQSGSMVLGGFLVILGALMHADLVAIGGSILCGIAILADLRGLVGAPGWGWRQIALLAFGVVLIAAGQWRRKHRRWSRRDEHDAILAASERPS